MKLLVVEDDHAVASTLRHLFASCHYAVDIATDGEAGLMMATSFNYDLILLDIMLPGIDGISLCTRLRETRSQTPILLLTGRSGSQEKAKALNAGADDYVVKPFAAEELLARVQALLRRGGPKTQPILTWSRLSIDPTSREVVYGGLSLSTTPKEYAILELFLRNPKKVFGAREILDQAWNSLESPGEESVRGHIKELRRKLKEAGAPDDLIKTRYRAGYQLNPDYASEVAARKTAQPVKLNAEFCTLENAIIQDPLVISPDTTVMEAVSLMAARHSALPTPETLLEKAQGVGKQTVARRAMCSDCVIVLEDEHVVGLLMSQTVIHLVAQNQSLDSLVVQQVMAKPIMTLQKSVSTDLQTVIALLGQYGITHLPVVDEQNRLVGVITYESIWC